MDKTTVAFVVIALAAVFALVIPMDVAVAQMDVMSDGDREYKDGEGKSCPNKEKKMQNTIHLT